jgi:hypothetical protein
MTNVIANQTIVVDRVLMGNERINMKGTKLM